VTSIKSFHHPSGSLLTPISPVLHHVDPSTPITYRLHPLLRSRQKTYLLTVPAVHNNCFRENSSPLPLSKPQIRVDPSEVNKNGAKWEKWLSLSYAHLADGSELIYSYEWALGDSPFASASHHTFVPWVYFTDGAFYHQVICDVSEHEKHPNGGFTYSIANSHLTWAPCTNLEHFRKR